MKWRKYIQSYNHKILLQNKGRDPTLTKNARVKTHFKLCLENKFSTRHKNLIWKGILRNHRKYFWLMTNKSILLRSKKHHYLKEARLDRCKLLIVKIHRILEIARKISRQVQWFPRQAKEIKGYRDRFKHLP